MDKLNLQTLKLNFNLLQDLNDEMDLTWGSIPSKKFVTNVGLITSNGHWGNNVMSAEWTHHISYEPGLIAVNIHLSDATAENIMKSKEFGVNIAAESQNVVCSIAGGYTGKEVNKIEVLKELGIEFYKARKIDVLMVKDATMNAECKIVEQMELGDHIMFVGKAIEITTDENTRPILYHSGKYYKVGDNVSKSHQEVLDKIKQLVEKYRKS